MKAAILEEVGGSMVLEEIPEPEPRQGEVLVKVAACGVCHTDLHVLKGEVGFPLPAVLGHEISGIVAAVAPDVTHLRPGDRVVSTFIMPCGYCQHCVRGRDDLCETFFALNRLKGVLYDGETRLHRKSGDALAMYSMAGLAEYAVAPATAVFPLPEVLDLHYACILGCAVPTAYGAVRHQAQLMPGESVAVIGVGGVGSNVIQVSRVFGAAQVIAVDISDEKLEAARRLGATDVVNAAREDPAGAVRELTGGQGADVVFEALGRSSTVVSGFHSVRDGGRLVVIGIAPGQEAAPIEITRLVRRSITLKGSYGGRMRTDVPELIRLVAAGQLTTSQLITRRYGFDEVNVAYDALSQGQITGRAIVVME
jgi:S-(hydroxymethyl)glutathione dehydrogenase/alcohol dehydrogenase